MMWIKICGITRLEDARMAEDLGADAIGFIFAPSPRQIEPGDAAEIADRVRVTRIGVFVDPTLEELEKTMSVCPLDKIQLHGRETPQFCRSVAAETIKGLRIRDRGIVESLPAYSGVWKILLDAYVPGKMGGTGRIIPEDLLQLFPSFDDIILAGGIGAANISGLFRRYRPFGFDISSSVEFSPGQKDAEKLKDLFNTIKNTR
jgi:phosphoribosylanthranilate isomerase